MSIFGPTVNDKPAIEQPDANDEPAISPVPAKEAHDLGPLVPARTSEAGKSDALDYYTAADLMVRLKVGRSKVREMLRTREIPSIKIGSLVRIRRKDLEEYLERAASAR